MEEHLEILLEDIRGKFDLVLEGHEVLRREIREVREESNAKHEQTALLIKAISDHLTARSTPWPPISPPIARIPRRMGRCGG